MRIVGVLAPGAHIAVQLDVGHGQDPRMLLWRAGWVLSHLLGAYLDDNGSIVLTAQVAQRKASSRPPRVKERGLDPSLEIAEDEIAIPHQRIAAYAVVRSTRGLLGTQCSDKTAIPGLWQLPGGGLESGETPSDGVIREVMEETGQTVRIHRLLDVQSDHWIGRGPTGRLEDFQALRIFYSAVCDKPSEPTVLDIGGTTHAARWLSVRRWRSLPWTSGSRSILDRYLSTVPTR